MKIYVLNGPNINMLGLREPAIYGSNSYENLLKTVAEHCQSKNVEYELFQTNSEGVLVDKIQQAYFDKVDAIVINPGAYTHTSIAILDAVKATGLPCVEVHISNVKEREDFRQISYVRLACVKTIMGKGIQGYLEAIDYLVENHK